MATPLWNLTLFECESHESVPSNPLVEKMVDSNPPLVDRTFRIGRELQTTQVLLISSYSNELGGDPPILKVQGDNPHVPMEQRRNSCVPIV